MPRSLKPRAAAAKPSSRKAPPRPKRTETPSPRAATKRLSFVKASAKRELEVPARQKPTAVEAPQTAFFQQGLLSHDQKRELILAHAAARQARRLPKGWFYVMGIVASCLVVMAGWWLTVGSWIRGQVELAKHTSFQQEVRQEIGRLEAAYPLQKPTIAEAKAVLLPEEPTVAVATSTGR